MIFLSIFLPKNFANSRKIATFVMSNKNKYEKIQSKRSNQNA